MRTRIFNTNLHKYAVVIVGVVMLLFANQVYAEDGLTTEGNEQLTDNNEQTTTTTDQTPNSDNQTPTSTEEIVPEETTTTTLSTTTTTTTTSTFSTNHVIVNYLNEEIFNNDVIVTSTWFYDSAGSLYYSTSTISALGVLAEASRQGEFPLTIQGGWGYYVSDVGNHPAQGFDGWIYNINQQDPGWVGMNDYLIQPDDLLTVFYSVWPWKIESNTSSIYLGENVNFTAFNYASSTWQTSPSTTISVNNQLFVTDDSGQYPHTPSATGTLSAFIYGSDSWPQNSPSINVEVLTPAPTSTPETTASSTPSSNESSGSGSSTSNTQTNNPPQIQPVSNANITSAANKILDYLKSQQDASGKIIDGGITDWAIMSFASAGIYGDEIKNGEESLLDYALNYDFADSSDLNLCAAYPRHVLALLAGGVDKTSAKITELKNKIKNQCFADAIYGQNGINDDIFGLFALLTTDEQIDATSTQTIINSIKSDQTADGAFTWAGWPGADITGGAINALKYAETKGASIEQEIYSNAKNYLKTNQLNDGGWGYGVSDALTTDWAVMGINALGETQSQWTAASGTNPWHVLVNQLKDDGYYESAWVPGATDWFATKHAVPALLGKSWPIVLPPKQNAESSEQNTNTIGSGGSSQNTETVTSTVPVVTTPTSTPATSSTLEQVATYTTTTTNEIISNQSLVISDESTPNTSTLITPLLITNDSPNATPSPATYNQKPKTSAIDTNNLAIQPQQYPLEAELRGGQFNNGTIEQFNNKNTSEAPQQPTETLSPAPENAVPVNKTAKGVFAGATSLAGALGLYLAWRFVQTLI